MTVKTAERTSAGDERGAVLTASARALDMEAHSLRERTKILWQQMHNRLQWDVDPVTQTLASAFAEESKPGSAPCVRNARRAI